MGNGRAQRAQTVWQPRSGQQRCRPEEIDKKRTCFGHQFLGTNGHGNAYEVDEERHSYSTARDRHSTRKKTSSNNKEATDCNSTANPSISFSSDWWAALR